MTAATDLTVDLKDHRVTGGGNQVNFSDGLGGNGIATIIGGAGNDLFQIDGAQHYALYGGPGDNSFDFYNNGSLTGLINSGAGHDLLDYDTDVATLVAVRYFTLTGLGGQWAAGVWPRGRARSGASFPNIDEIISNNNIDTLQGANLDATFAIHGNTPATQSIDYTAGGHSLHTTLIENLVGGNQQDLFIFDDQATLPGIANSIDGKAGIDTLDYSAYTTDVTVDLQSGIATGVKNGVSEIENVIGSLTGINNLYGDNGNNTFPSPVRATISSIGRGGNDTYIFAADNPLGSVTIYEDAAHGGSGVDTISFAPTVISRRCRDGGSRGIREGPDGQQPPAAGDLGPDREPDRLERE